MVKSLHGSLRLACVSTELLAKPDGCGVLQVGPARLDDGPELLGFGLQRLLQPLERRNKVVLDGRQSRDVYDRGNDVVGGLAHVHVVVGVNEFRASISAQQLSSAVGDDLVGICVGGRAGTRLEDVQHKMLVQHAIDDLLGSLDDCIADLGVQQPKFHVGLGRGLLDKPQSANEASRESKIAYGEVQHCPHGGRAVIGVLRHIHFPHGVSFNPCLAGVFAGHVTFSLR